MKFESWYDYPQYFDMAFRDETPAELLFLGNVLQRYVTWSPRLASTDRNPAASPVRMYEPGCGSGRLVAALASKGHHVVALDNNAAMLRYLRHRLSRSKRVARRGGHVEIVLGDMVDHVCQRPVDLAFCTFNTFRHLTTETSARQHLRSVAQSLRPGGVYILGLHCLPMDVDPDSTERWSARHGRTHVSITFRVMDFHRRRRIENIRVSIKATRTDTGVVKRIRSEFPLRIYTPQQACRLMTQVDDCFELVAIHDFDYDIDQTRVVDNDLIDAVFVLRRRDG